jgi:peroxiredoxin
MILKGLGDDGDIMRKRLTYLRKAIIQSSDIDLGGTSVAKLAEDELYVIRFLTKGRIAPDLAGSDSGGAPMKLSNFNGKVVMLLFWSSTMIEADRVAAMTNDLMLKHQGKPFVVVGVNQDPLAKLRSLEGAQESPVMWKSFSDPTKELAGQYRVGTWPLVYVLDGDRRISYAGPPGSFAEATVDALLAPKAPGAK